MSSRLETLHEPIFRLICYYIILPSHTFHPLYYRFTQHTSLTRLVSLSLSSKTLYDRLWTYQDESFWRSMLWQCGIGRPHGGKRSWTKLAKRHTLAVGNRRGQFLAVEHGKAFEEWRRWADQGKVKATSWLGFHNREFDVQGGRLQTDDQYKVSTAPLPLSSGPIELLPVSTVLEYAVSLLGSLPDCNSQLRPSRLGTTRIQRGSLVSFKPY
jgi:hypothetical protein